MPPFPGRRRPGAVRLALAAALAAAALAGDAPPAGARAPGAPEQGSLDWILERLKSDRVEDQNPVIIPEEQKCIAYRKGDSALDEWAPVADVVRAPPRNRSALRGTATDTVSASETITHAAWTADAILRSRRSG